MKLIIHQFGRRTASLESTPDRGVVFSYDPEYLASAGAKPLSISLPLREGEYTQAEAMPFFAGLLPDGELKRRIADYLHVSEASTLRLLSALGGECAGTISIEREADDDDDEEREPKAGQGKMAEAGYEELPKDELATLILESDRRPLLASLGASRLSLAGAQEKLPLLRRDGHWLRPLGGAPTTHILKPSSAGFPDIVANEFLSMRLAKRLGLGVPNVEMETIGRPVLIVERYDRRISAEGIERIHQEDFCQALRIMPDRKYQSDEGPGFSDLSGLIRNECVAPVQDIERLIRCALFNLLLGNCDAHGKNFSILYADTGLELAPFYDLLSTTIYPELEMKLSMKLGKENRIDKVVNSDLTAFAVDVGVRPKLVSNELERLIVEAEEAWAEVMALTELGPYGETVTEVRKGWGQRAKRFKGLEY